MVKGSAVGTITAATRAVPGLLLLLGWGLEPISLRVHTPLPWDAALCGTFPPSFLFQLQLLLE